MIRTSTVGSKLNNGYKITMVDRFASVFSALAFWSLSGCFFVSWYKPLWLWNGQWVVFGVHIFILEFLVIHSGAFLVGVNQIMKETKKKRLRRFLPLIWFGGYTLFALPLIISTGSWQLLVAFLAIFLPRAVTLFGGLSEFSAGHILAQSTVSMLLYIGLVFLTVVFTFPELGLSELVLENLEFKRTGGEWNKHPQNALASGTVYFFLLGALEWFIAFWVPPAPAKVPAGNL